MMNSSLQRNILPSKNPSKTSQRILRIIPVMITPVQLSLLEHAHGTWAHMTSSP